MKTLNLKSSIGCPGRRASCAHRAEWAFSGDDAHLGFQMRPLHLQCQCIYKWLYVCKCYYKHAVMGLKIGNN